MACYHPLRGFRRGDGGWTASPVTGYRDRPMLVPCGQCIGCRLEYSRQWAIRIMHEASLHRANSFITLTFDDDHLPGNGSLSVRDMQLFNKRLRKSAGKLRYFYCGEYGDENMRPHYHACIFGHDFPDKVLFKARGKHRLYRSAQLERLWPFGYSTIGSLTFHSAAYVARYVLKKRTGAQAPGRYRSVDPSTGEVVDRYPEFCQMSRRPGIAHDWLERYKTDVYPHDYVVMNGRKLRPPKYYDNLFGAECDAEMREIKQARIRAARSHDADRTSDRLAVREEVAAAKLVARSPRAL